jgi:hypothetical protein
MAEQTAPAPAVEPSKYDDYDYPATKATPQSGHPGHTTPEQDAKVIELRTLLEQDGYTQRLDTHTLVSFEMSCWRCTKGTGLIRLLNAAPILEGSEVRCRELEADVRQGNYHPLL